MGVLEQLAAELGLAPDELRAELLEGTGEASVPNYLTVTPAGLVGANFTGHVSAQGVDIPALARDPAIAAPPTPNAVRWLRTSDGAMIAEIWGENDVAGSPKRLEIGVLDDAGATVLIRRLLASDGSSDFLQLSTSANVKSYGPYTTGNVGPLAAGAVTVADVPVAAAVLAAAGARSIIGIPDGDANSAVITCGTNQAVIVAGNLRLFFKNNGAVATTFVFRFFVVI